MDEIDFIIVKKLMKNSEVKKTSDETFATALAVFLQQFDDFCLGR